MPKPFQAGNSRAYATLVIAFALLPGILPAQLVYVWDFLEILHPLAPPGGALMEYVITDTGLMLVGPAPPGVPAGNLEVDPTSRFAYMTAGRGVQALSIGPNGVTPIGAPISTGEFDPGVLRVDAAGRFVYVSLSRPGGPGAVQVLAIGPTGTLTPIGQPVPTAGNPADLVTTTEFLYYVASGRINAFRIGSSGDLSPIDPGVTVSNAGPLFANASGKFLYSWSASGLHTFSIGPSGALTLIGTAVLAGVISGSAVHPGGFMYVLRNDLFPTGRVEAYRIEPTGTLTFLSAVSGGGSGRAVGTGFRLDATGQFALVVWTVRFSDVTWLYRIETMGSLTPIATVLGELRAIVPTRGPVEFNRFTITQGSNQTAPTGHQFAQRLQVRLTAPDGRPVADTPVTFTAQSLYGPGGLFPGTIPAYLQAVVVTDTQGLATAPALTANMTAGTYRIRVTAPGAVQTFFVLTNSPPPSNESVNPNSGAGVSGVFTFRYSHLSGYANLRQVFGSLNDSAFGTQGCNTMYLRDNNGLYLKNETDDGWLGPLTPGASGTVTNSRCTLDGSGSAVSGSGNTLSLTVALTFKAAFAGPKGIYMYAIDSAGATTPTREQRGSWTVPSQPLTGAAYVYLRSLSGSTLTQYIFTQTGLTLVGPVLTLFNTGQTFCAGLLEIDPTGRFAYMADGRAVRDLSIGPTGALTGISPGIPIGEEFYAQCAEIDPTGKFLFVTFNAGPPGPGAVRAISIGPSGTWTPVGPPIPTTGGPVNLVSTGEFLYVLANSQLLAYRIGPTGALTTIDSGIQGTVGSHFVLHPGGKFLYIHDGLLFGNDLVAYSIGPTGALTPIGPVATGVGCCGQAVHPTGNFMYVTHPSKGRVAVYRIESTGTLTFLSDVVIAEPSRVAVDATGQLAFVSGLNETQAYRIAASGALTAIGSPVPGSVAGIVTLSTKGPSNDSVSPNNSGGMSGVFTFRYSHPSGYSNLRQVFGSLNASAFGQSGCNVYYLRDNNGLYLKNDTDDGWLGPLIPGAPGTVTNSRCTLDGSSSSVFGSGNTFWLTVSLTFRPAFAGAKGIYMYAIDSAGLTTPTREQRGSWTVGN